MPVGFAGMHPPPLPCAPHRRFAMISFFEFYHVYICDAIFAAGLWVEYGWIVDTIFLDVLSSAGMFIPCTYIVYIYAAGNGWIEVCYHVYCHVWYEFIL